MTPAELHAAVRAAVTARLELARAATPGPWRVCAEGSEGSRVAPDYGDVRERSRFIAVIGGRVQPEDGRNARHIAANDPAAVIRACELDLSRLSAHWPMRCGCCNAIDCPANPQVHPRARCDAGHDVMWPRCYEVENIGRVYAVAVEE